MSKAIEAIAALAAVVGAFTIWVLWFGGLLALWGVGIYLLGTLGGRVLTYFGLL